MEGTKRAEPLSIPDLHSFNQVILSASPLWSAVTNVIGAPPELNCIVVKGLACWEDGMLSSLQCRHGLFVSSRSESIPLQRSS